MKFLKRISISFVIAITTVGIGQLITGNLDIDSWLIGWIGGCIGTTILIIFEE